MKHLLSCLIIFVTIYPVVSAESEGEFGVLSGSFSFQAICIQMPELVAPPNKFGHPARSILHISKLIS